jgi:hypothetical protein
MGIVILTNCKRPGQDCKSRSKLATLLLATVNGHVLALTLQCQYIKIEAGLYAKLQFLKEGYTPCPKKCK